MGKHRPTSEEKALAAGIVAGEKRGRLTTIAAILEAQAAAIITEQYAQISAAVASGGVIAGTQALAQGLKGVWSGMWRVAMRGPLLEVMKLAELRTNKGTYQPPFDINRPGFAEFFDNYVHEFVKQVNGTSRDAIAEVLREAQEGGYSVDRTVQRIREEAAEVSQVRARMIARTELNNAARAASFEKARRSQIVQAKTWMHSRQPNPREEHLAQDGVTVGLEERFPDGSLYPDAINCRCALQFEISDEILGRNSA